MDRSAKNTAIGFGGDGGPDASLRDLREAYMWLNRALRKVKQARACVVSWDFKKIDRILELAESNGRMAREAMAKAGRKRDSDR